jgi:hypothetical protein
MHRDIAYLMRYDSLASFAGFIPAGTHDFTKPPSPEFRTRNQLGARRPAFPSLAGNPVWGTDVGRYCCPLSTWSIESPMRVVR